jgi:hypothetical protein
LDPNGKELDEPDELAAAGRPVNPAQPHGATLGRYGALLLDDDRMLDALSTVSEALRDLTAAA